MQLKDIMRRNVITTPADESVVDAAKRMREGNVGCLVVTSDGTLQGIVTDRDLLIGCVGAGHDPQQCRVSHHMSSPVISGGGDMDVLDAAHMMVSRKIKRLPIVQGSQLAGLVSLSDIGHTMR